MGNNTSQYFIAG